MLDPDGDLSWYIWNHLVEMFMMVSHVHWSELRCVSEVLLFLFFLLSLPFMRIVPPLFVSILSYFYSIFCYFVNPATPKAHDPLIAFIRYAYMAYSNQYWWPSLVLLYFSCQDFFYGTDGIVNRVLMCLWDLFLSFFSLLIVICARPFNNIFEMLHFLLVTS